MLDYNHRPTWSETLTESIDAALQENHRKQAPRNYLGASRLGVACDRALQYKYLQTPVDHDRELSGQTLRIFQAGHVFETLMIDWLRQAGFELYTETANGDQYGFSAADGKMRGHVDGILANGPESANLRYPALWEAKSLSNRSWRDTVKRGLAVSKPVYAAQIALYQAYLEPQIPKISRNDALFTAINKDTAELYFERIPFDGGLAQRTSDRGVKVLKACEAHELLPRLTRDPTHYQCTFCPWQDRCWQQTTTCTEPGWILTTRPTRPPVLKYPVCMRTLNRGC